MKELTVITNDTVTLETIQRQIYSLMGEDIKVKGYNLEDDEAQKIQGRVVLISCSSIAPDIFKKYTFEDQVHIIVAQRSIDKSGIKKLLGVKPGTRAAVIVGHRNASEVTIQAIKGLGITQIDFVTEQEYYNGTRNVDIIITPGKSLRIHADIPVLDIGIRNLDVTTVVEILMAFHIYDKYKCHVSNKYTSPIIELSQELHSAFTQISQMKDSLESLVNASHDGVIMVDKNLEISVINNKVCEMFRIKKENVLGKCFSRELGFPCDWQEVLNNTVIRYGENSLLIGVTPVSSCDGDIGRVVTFRDVTEIQKLEQIVRKNTTARGHVAHYTFKDIIGESPEIVETKKIAAQIANTEGTTLIYGESGVGKELYAQAIHRSSKRKNGPFVAINFSALPDNLVESELFGYEEGAFTGARKGGKPGFFEMAHGGTIFLDEIGDADLYIQTRLLRVLQEKEVMRIGSTKVIPVDVRVITATNKYLPQLVKEKKFREDLYYRLNVLPLSIPPLRKRGKDVLLLFDHLCTQKGLTFRLTESAQELLLSHCWPGNVRELVNLIEYLCCTKSYNDVIDIKDFPIHLIESVTSCPVPVHINHSPLVTSDKNEKNTCDNYGLTNELVKVLKQIYINQQNGINSGRRSLANLIPGITEARIRSILKELEKKGLLELNLGRKGARLTSRGIEAIKTTDII